MEKKTKIKQQQNGDKIMKKKEIKMKIKKKIEMKKKQQKNDDKNGEKWEKNRSKK